MRSNRPNFNMKKIFCALLFLFLIVLVISNISHAPNKFGITKTSNQPSSENSTQQEEQKDNQLNYVPSFVEVGGFYGREDSEGGMGTQAQSTTTDVFFENTLTYNKEFNDDHRLNVLAGT